MSRVEPVAATLQRFEKPALLAGAAGIVLGIAGWVLWPGQFYRSYLLAYLFWFSIALGTMPILMLHHLVGGRWGFASRRILESATRTIPLLAVLFVPIMLGIPHLYEWSHADAVMADPILQQKASYLNTPFFIVRAAGYFAAWLIFAGLLNRWSAQQDRTGDPAWVRKFQLLSGPGLVVYALTVTFASIDWVMSLEPHWFSTIYGLTFITGQVLAALAFTIAVIAASAAGTLHDQENRGAGVLHDLGNLTLAFVMLWAYLSFSQYLIIWAGNLPEEIPWYLTRAAGGWQWVAVALALFHFAAPFALLLARRNKRRARILSWIAIGILVMRFVDLVWLVVPAHEPQFHLHGLDFVLFAGLGGLWSVAFLRQLRRLPLLPLGDPEFSAGRERA